MVRRASEKSFFSGLSSQIKKWVMANSDPRLQSNVWYVYFKEHAPPTFQSFGCFRMAKVNMGSEADPCVVRFYGYPQDKPGFPNLMGSWFCEPEIPWITSNQGEMSSILDELDTRGGMA